MSSQFKETCVSNKPAPRAQPAWKGVYTRVKMQTQSTPLNDIHVISQRTKKQALIFFHKNNCVSDQQSIINLQTRKVNASLCGVIHNSKRRIVKGGDNN